MIYVTSDCARPYVGDVAQAAVGDGSVTGWQGVAVWLASIIGGLALIGLGVFFVVNGLDRAGQVR